jgi:hypothetical protein
VATFYERGNESSYPLAAGNFMIDMTTMHHSPNFIYKYIYIFLLSSYH